MGEERKYTFRTKERRKNSSILDSIIWRRTNEERRSSKDRRKSI